MKIMTLILAILSLNVLAIELTDNQKINYENLNKCFSSTNWGRQLDPSVTNSPSAKFISYEQINAGSKVHFEPNLLVVPVTNGGQTQVHLIQFRQSSGWFGSSVDYKPMTLNLNIPSHKKGCDANSYNSTVLDIGGDCFVGPREQNNKCNMARLSIDVTSSESGSKVCTKMTNDKARLNTSERANTRPLTLNTAADIARKAVIDRLKFLEEQVANGKLDTSRLSKNLSYAASGPCTEIFSGSANAPVKAASLSLLCKVSPQHQDCIQGDINNGFDNTVPVNNEQ